MKILITSDIHKDLKSLNHILEKEKNIKTHLDAGDSNLNNNILDEKNILSVKGNTDFFSKLPIQRLLTLDNKKILVIHGHTLRVKFHLHNLVDYAKTLKVDICIFGHTHKQFLKEAEGIIFLNPGAVLDGHYAVYEDGKIKLY